MLLGTKFQITTAAFVLCCALGEIGCYIIFFHHAYKHDNGPIKLLLPPEVTRQRNRKNLISFAGQFQVFLTQITFKVALITIMAMDIEGQRLKAIMVLVKCMDFGILSFVEVAVSEDLRNLLFAH